MIEVIETPESSTIVRIQYDDETLVMTVEFKAGIYNYFDIPSNVFDGMRVAPSKGSYLAHNVKGIYRYARA